MRVLVRLLVAVSLLGAPVASATDWPHLRGPELNGRVATSGIFDGDDVGLELSWTAPIGSAYSGVVVAGGRVVTSFTDGETDWVAAFDAADGREIWRQRLGEATKGHDGSDDGPLSSPVIGDGKVYALSPSGLLLALRLDDGKPVWKTRLAQEFAAEPPFFGFTSTPLYVDGKLVVQVGAPDGSSIVALDAGKGKRLWAGGDGAIDYQSPTVMTLAGKRQIVAVSKTTISGLSVEDGEVLWGHDLGEDDYVSSANPTFVGEDRFLIAMSGGVTVYRLSRDEAGFGVEEVYRSKDLGQSYAPPIYLDGYLYGFRGQVLTCVDAANGKRVWRSRPPGGDGLILVDGHLVVFGAKGYVVVIEATPEGYRERVRVQALEGSGLTWPSFADGRVYVRNLEALAAVSVSRGGGAATVASGSRSSGKFGRWLAAVGAADDPQAMVDEFFEGHGASPIVEGETVHFVFRSDATDVAIAGSMIDTETAEPMERVEGTDLFHRAYRLEPGGRWEYRFQIDFESWEPDPLNPRSVPVVEGEGTFSELVAEPYRIGGHLDEPQGPRGRLESFTLESEFLGYEKEIQVWLPPGYDDGDQRYSLLVVNDGEAWLSKGLMTNTLDNLVDSSVEPIIVAFVPPYRRWWLEAGGSHTDDYVRMQAEELVPALTERYRLIDAAEARGVMGNRFFGVSAAYAALKYPEVFGNAAVQSTYLGLGAGDALVSMIEQNRGRSVRIYLDWNRYDERRVDRGYDFAVDSRRLAEMLNSAGYEITGGELLDSVGWGGWRNRTDQILVALFGDVPQTPE